MEIIGPYVVVSEEFWNNFKSKIRRLNSDLIPEMDEAAKLIELDNHHNAAICPYCQQGTKKVKINNNPPWPY